MTEKQVNFIMTVGELARDDMKESKILASLTVAQAILESGWGTSGLATIGKALFGIKGTNWTGAVYNSNTQECYNGKDMVTINANFRAYNSWEESIKDHTKLLTTAPRYKSLIGVTDYVKACRLIKECGYATDPDYPSKLVKIIESNKLYEYDAPLENKKTKIKIRNMENDYGFEIDGNMTDNQNFGSVRQLLETMGFYVTWENGEVCYSRIKEVSSESN